MQQRYIPMGYYVYELQDPSTRQTFYVGKGTGRRMYQHASKAQSHQIPNGSNFTLYRKLKDMLTIHGSIQYHIVNDNMNESEAYALEDACIEYHGLPNLCNRIRFNKGCINRPSNGMLGKTHNDATKSKQFIASIIQYNGNFVNYFEKLYQKKRQPTLRKDLRLLNSVIKEMRERLEREEKQKVYMVTTRLCPICNRVLHYNTRKSMMRATRLKHLCKRCAKLTRRDTN